MASANGMDGAVAWRWNTVKNIYLFLLKHILSPSLLLSLSLPLTPTAKEHLPEKKSTTPSSSFPS